jgi:hypothetical protein
LRGEKQMGRKKEVKIVKVIMHKEYNHELSKHYNRRRWVKEDKRFYWKRRRRKWEESL